MIPVVFSACLLGEACRFDGAAHTADAACRLAKKVKACIVCPEVLGGLKTPRLPAECVGERVKLSDGTDVTAAFSDGARKALESARAVSARLAILKAKSPSCGSDYVFDGTFTRRLVPGEGLACQLFRRHGIAVFNEAIVADREVRPYRPIALFVHQDQDFNTIIDSMSAHHALSMGEDKDSAEHTKEVGDSKISMSVAGTWGTTPVVVYRADRVSRRTMIDACLPHAYQEGARQAITCSVDTGMARSIDVFEITGSSAYRKDTYLLALLGEIARAEGIEIAANQRRHVERCDEILCPTFEYFTIFLQRLFYLLTHDLA